MNTHFFNNLSKIILFKNGTLNCFAIYFFSLFLLIILKFFIVFQIPFHIFHIHILFFLFNISLIIWINKHVLKLTRVLYFFFIIYANCFVQVIFKNYVRSFSSRYLYLKFLIWSKNSFVKQSAFYSQQRMRRKLQSLQYLF